MGETPGEFNGWSHGSIIHHKATGPASPRATSDHCRMRLIRERERFQSGTHSLTGQRRPLPPRRVPLQTKLLLARSARQRHTHESPARLENAVFITWIGLSSPSQPLCGSFQRLCILSARCVFCCHQRRAWRFNHSADKSSKVNFDGEIKTEQRSSRAGLLYAELLMGWVIPGYESWAPTFLF